MTSKVEVVPHTGPIRLRVSASEPVRLRVSVAPFRVRVLGMPGPDGRQGPEGPRGPPGPEGNIESGVALDGGNF